MSIVNENPHNDDKKAFFPIISKEIKKKYFLLLISQSIFQK